MAKDNNRLREEIKKLKGALKDIKDDILIEAPMLKKNMQDTLLNHSLKAYDKLESLRSEEIEMLCKFEKFEEEELLESSLRFSVTEKSQGNHESIKYKKYSPSVDTLGGSLAIGSEEVSEKLSSVSIENLKFAAFQDSFSEKGGNPEFKSLSPLASQATIGSILDPDNKGSFKPLHQDLDQQKLLNEIEKLRKENSKLRSQLQSTRLQKLTKEIQTPSAPKTLSPSDFNRIRIKKSKSSAKSPVLPSSNSRLNRFATRSASRSKSLTPRDRSEKSTTPRSPLTPHRLKHCNICTHLLSKGYSTKYCSKHGTCPNK